jgi:hypothetical protein
MQATTAARRLPCAKPGAAGRAAYLRRIASVYLFPAQGPLSFWYETPEINPRALGRRLRNSAPREYYMTFAGKARYRGPFDSDGVPLLDYRGEIGLQSNPIAIAQYGLASYNRFLSAGDPDARAAAIRAAGWMVRHLESAPGQVPVWQHHFDWPYRQVLRAPWRSGLAQGCGVSLLVRIATETGEAAYADAARAAFRALTLPVAEGGVLVRDGEGALWIEEYLVTPPSHILNGFIWAAWGVYDFARWAHDSVAFAIFNESMRTLVGNLRRFDTGNWSRYELSDEGPPMLASPYYHRLHIVQLRVLYEITGLVPFSEYAARWERYERSRLLRNWALARKIWFKLRRY